MPGNSVIRTSTSPAPSWLDRLSEMPAPSPLATTFLILASLLVLRLPNILDPHEWNQDESFMLGHGMRFLLDPVPWRSVDGASIGPLNSHLLAAILWLGVKPSFMLLHFIAYLLVSLQTLTAYWTLLRLVSQRAAAWGALPMVLFFGLTGTPDYLHDSSEVLPALLAALGFYSFVRWATEDGSASLLHRLLPLFLSGIAWGAAPWGKLQEGPISGVLGLLVVLAVCSKVRDRALQRVFQLAVFGLGAILPSAVLLTVIVRGGALKDFWTSYIVGNLAYVGGETWTDTLIDCAKVLLSAGIGPLTCLVALACVLFVYDSEMDPRQWLSGKNIFVYSGLALYFCAALFACARPVTFVPHYFVFLVYPMTCIAGILGTRAFPVLKEIKQSRKNMPLAVTVPTVGIIAFYQVNAALFLMLNAVTVYGLFRPRVDSNDMIYGEIRKLKAAYPVKSIGIWGWAPGVFVLTGIPPAVRDVCNQANVHSKGFLQAYYQHRFADDMRRASPDLFIDAVAPGEILWNWTENDAYESNPELKNYIDDKYVLVDEIALKPHAKPVRIFARRDAAAAQQQAAVRP